MLILPRLGMEMDMMGRGRGRLLGMGKLAGMVVRLGMEVM